MLIDFEGTLTGGAGTAILLDRPPSNMLALGSLLQFGFPATTPTLVSGMEIWTTNSPVSFLFLPPAGASYRFQLATLPPAPQVFSAQFVCFLMQPLTCAFDLAASPALVFSY